MTAVAERSPKKTVMPGFATCCGFGRVLMHVRIQEDTYTLWGPAWPYMRPQVTQHAEPDGISLGSRVQAWDDHCKRLRNRLAWAPILVNYWGRETLPEHLARNSHGDEGQTRTRACGGFPASRWHDGVQLAKSKLLAA
eukprot:TRINITY_DN20704_c0_g1_i1.p1 TRINITY_DN20704_c0_g1~~TRINITY_DN20704_c0_g1_i1.p1  ORF type:complete len:138 (-),score=5.01 TRINITY_DN20704_c0_g1_i1:170-583(-)